MNFKRLFSKKPSSSPRQDELSEPLLSAEMRKATTSEPFPEIGHESERASTYKPPVLRPSIGNVLTSMAKNVYSHVTRETNVAKIVGSQGAGLDPGFGGKGGASEAFKAIDASTAQTFSEHSRNFIHLGLDSEGRENRPSEFYSDFYARQGIESRVLHVTMPTGASVIPDPDDTQGGRYKTSSAISQQHIVHIPLSTAFRAPGTIGADYAPEPFVRQATQEIGGRSVMQRTEDIRRAVHSTSETIYPDTD